MGVVSPSPADRSAFPDPNKRTSSYLNLELDMMSEVSPLNHPRPSATAAVGGNPFGLTIMSFATYLREKLMPLLGAQVDDLGRSQYSLARESL